MGLGVLESVQHGRSGAQKRSMCTKAPSRDNVNAVEWRTWTRGGLANRDGESQSRDGERMRKDSR